MNLEYFIIYSEGSDVAAAFDAAVAEAQYEHGYGGNTGSIAEKDSFVVIESSPRSETEAEGLAKELLDAEDERIADEWGPAGAIAVCGRYRTLEGLPVPVRAEGYPSQKAAALAAAETHLGNGEIVTSATLTNYRPRGNEERVYVNSHTTATILTTGSLDLTGWIFVGWAAS
ncbi:hypothetical protein [Amycolatopsis sp. cmx-4-61]|uniref:hypothetical protein n=1 Tax=Amycolatopsis sp. cmx-4-61 TaxID=2790937 RepID=UPI003978D522